MVIATNVVSVEIIVIIVLSVKIIVISVIIEILSIASVIEVHFPICLIRSYFTCNVNCFYQLFGLAAVIIDLYGSAKPFLNAVKPIWSFNLTIISLFAFPSSVICNSFREAIKFCMREAKVKIDWKPCELFAISACILEAVLFDRNASFNADFNVSKLTGVASVKILFLLFLTILLLKWI